MESGIRWIILGSSSLLLLGNSLALINRYISSGCEDESIKYMIYTSAMLASLIFSLSIGNIMCNQCEKRPEDKRNSYKRDMFTAIVLLLFSILYMIVSISGYTNSVKKCADLKKYMIINILISCVILITSIVMIITLRRFKKN